MTGPGAEAEPERPGSEAEQSGPEAAQPGAEQPGQSGWGRRRSSQGRS
jgi:hypothetical protein